MSDKIWLKTYVNKLIKDNFANANLYDFINLCQQHIPNKLYRFRSLTKEVINVNGEEKTKAEQEIQNFQNSQIYLSAPQNFNDPYDSKPLFDPFKLFEIFVGDEELRNLFKINIEELMRKTDISKNTYPKEINELFINIRDTFSKLVPNITSGIKSSCFSENNYTNMLMWSHYAKDHKGYCIEYDGIEIKNNYQHTTCLFPVIYSDTIFDLSEHFMYTFKQMFKVPDIQREYLTNKSLMIFISILYKALCWNYEKEWRIVVQPNNKEVINGNLLTAPKPSKIYLGTNIDKAYREQLIEVADNMKIPVYDMFLKGNEYSLVPKQIGK